MGKPGRRTVLRASGALLAGAAIAGCLEDGEADADDDSGSSLTVTNIAFSDGEPLGYRDFEEIENTTFEQSDVVWVYFEPAGFERDSIGGGEAEVDIEMSFSVTGPDGEELVSDTDTLARTAPEDGSVDAFFVGNFQPPIPAPGGEYTVTLTVTDRIADAEAEETTTFTVEAGEELAIENVTFIADQPRGYRDFDTVSDDTYDVTDPIRVYFEPTGFGTTDAAEGELRLDMITSLRITDSQGTVVYENDDVLRMTLSEDQIEEYFAFWGANLPADVDPGEYTAEITLEDQISEQTAETTAPFRLESADRSQYGRQFLNAINSELNVTVTGFEEGRTANLTYDTPASSDSSTAEEQIGDIAGAFAGLVGQGWSVDRLVATLTDSDDERSRFNTDAETAQAYIDGELTDEQYVSEVLSTLTQV